MKRVLLLSLAGNLCLAGAVFHLMHPRPPAAPANAPAPAPPLIVTNSVPFHWRQVESSSYPEYIANLRAIGCPEPTIHDVISADLKSLYETRRAALRAKAASPADATRLAETLLREEETVKQRLLAAPASAAPPADPLAERRRPSGAPAPRPSAGAPSGEELLTQFHDRETSTAQLGQLYHALKPSELELQLIQGFSQELAAEFATPPAATPDPAWEKRRRTALQNADDLLRSLIGYQRYNEYLREAVARQTTAP